MNISIAHILSFFFAILKISFFNFFFFEHVKSWITKRNKSKKLKRRRATLEKQDFYTSILIFPKTQILTINYRLPILIFPKTQILSINYRLPYTFFYHFSYCNLVQQNETTTSTIQIISQTQILSNFLFFKKVSVIFHQRSKMIHQLWESFFLFLKLWSIKCEDCFFLFLEIYLFIYLFMPAFENDLPIVGILFPIP